MTVSEYQLLIRERFEVRFQAETVCEWRAQMNDGCYSPRLDIAVGPFAIENGVRYIDNYNQLFHDNMQLIRRMARVHLENLNYFDENTPQEAVEQMVEEKIQAIFEFNVNARCFIAIEIENSVNEKHLMGGALNAAVLGRIAIGVGYTEKKHKNFLNLCRYFRFLEEVKKPTFGTQNLLAISQPQLIDLLA